MTALAFAQLTTPVGGVAASTLLTLAPVLTPLALLTVYPVTAWAVVISNSVVAIVPAVFVWGMPGAGASRAGGGAAATGLWAVVTGAFDRFKWLITRVTAGIRCRPSCSPGNWACCSKDCRLTDPLDAAESRLNQPAEFVARVGSGFR